MKKNILPDLVKVSRNCGLTVQMEQILKEKLSDVEMEIFLRWLQIVNEETNKEPHYYGPNRPTFRKF